ncbi:MAG: DNA polymerase III subunit delta [Ignavibacteriales bacterium]|nr:DNA polymerase III subunit delta [Ignavibacteriales bacterium]
MAKSKFTAPSVLEAIRQIKKGTLLPLYYFFGVDGFIINEAYHLLEKKISPLISTEFDKQVIYANDNSLVEILDAASAFPFGSDKKFIVVKEADKLKDKKGLVFYCKQPPSFTTLLFLHSGEIPNLDSEPFPSLYSFGYLFEGKELKRTNLIDWLLDFAESKNLKLSKENAQMLVDIVGENRSMLEHQFEKFTTFLGDKKEISIETITALSTELKEFNIFDLLNAIGKREKAKALKIVMNLYEKENELISIVAMLNKYFTGLLRLNEMNEKKIDPVIQARIIGTNKYYLKDYENARKNFSDFQLYNAIEAILKADIQKKSSFTDDRTLLTALISEILAEK